MQLEAFSLTLACVTHALGAARVDSGLSRRSLDLPLKCSTHGVVPVGRYLG